MPPIDPRPRLPAGARAGPAYVLGPAELAPCSPLFDAAILPPPLGPGCRRQLAEAGAWRRALGAHLLALTDAHRLALAGPGRPHPDSPLAQRRARLAAALAGLGQLLEGAQRPPPTPRPALWTEPGGVRPAQAAPSKLEAVPVAAAAAAVVAAGGRLAARNDGGCASVELWATEASGRPTPVSVAVAWRLPRGADGRWRALAACQPDSYWADYPLVEQACLKLAGLAGTPPWGGGDSRADHASLCGALAGLAGGLAFSLPCHLPAAAAYLDDGSRPAVVTVPASPAARHGDRDGEPAATAAWGDDRPEAGVPHAVLARAADAPRLTLLNPLRLCPDTAAWYGIPPAGAGALVEVDRSALAAMGACLFGVAAAGADT